MKMIQAIIEKWKGMNNTDRVKNVITYLFGTLCMPFGIVLTINAHLGAGGVDAMNFAIADALHANPSVGMYITSGVSAVIAAICRKGRINWPAFCTSILCAVFTDMWEVLLSGLQGTTMVSSLILFIAGLLALGIGVGSMVSSMFPAGLVDDLMVAIYEVAGHMGIVKIIIEGVCGTIAFLLGGEIGLGTFIIIFCLGPIIDISHKVLKKVIFGQTIA